MELLELQGGVGRQFMDHLPVPPLAPPTQVHVHIGPSIGLNVDTHLFDGKCCAHVMTLVVLAAG